MLRNEKAKTKCHGQFYQVDARVFDLGLKPIPFAVYSYGRVGRNCIAAHGKPST